MATTYTRIKNRRGLRADLPQPLADGEIGLATDTREVYIGAGTQDLLNSDVQVTPFLNAQQVVEGDVKNIDSATTNNGLLFFNLTGTQTLTGDGVKKNTTYWPSHLCVLPCVCGGGLRGCTLWGGGLLSPCLSPLPLLSSPSGAAALLPILSLLVPPSSLCVCVLCTPEPTRCWTTTRTKKLKHVRQLQG